MRPALTVLVCAACSAFAAESDSTNSIVPLREVKHSRWPAIMARSHEKTLPSPIFQRAPVPVPCPTNPPSATPAPPSDPYGNLLDTPQKRIDYHNARKKAARDRELYPSIQEGLRTGIIEKTDLRETFSGFRAGHVYVDGYYKKVFVGPGAIYVAPLGKNAGMRVLTLPEYMQYASYASYPVEIAVGLALQREGICDSPLEGNTSELVKAVAKYQQRTGQLATGAITPGLLKSLAVQQTLPPP